VRRERTGDNFIHATVDFSFKLRFLCHDLSSSPIAGYLKRKGEDIAVVQKGTIGAAFP